VLCDRHERAGLGLRSVRREDEGHEDERRLADQRHQDLDLERAHRRLHDRAVPHLSSDQGKPPPRADAIPGRHADAGDSSEPVYQLTGQHDFNEVVFQDAFMPDDHVLGEIDGAWKQATSELAYERSGPERFLETFYVLTGLVRALGEKPDIRSAEGLGRLVAQLHTLRRMSVSVNGMLQAGKEPVVEGSIVKDMGTVWEQKLPNRVRELAAFIEETEGNRATLEEQLRFATMIAPKLTIQGGTTEVLRGIIARGLGLR
jgi:alkylation response protein AidB-like acyl-CoA dehydrogenase